MGSEQNGGRMPGNPAPGAKSVGGHASEFSLHGLDHHALWNCSDVNDLPPDALEARGRCYCSSVPMDSLC